MSTGQVETRAESAEERFLRDSVKRHVARGAMTEEEGRIQADLLVARYNDVPASEGSASGDATTHTAESVAARANRADTDPTEAQKQSGNYRKGSVTIHGLRIAIENPKGSVRRGQDADGTLWERTMAAHYGYVKATEGFDSDPVDVFVGDQPDSDMVYVIDQLDRNGLFDEHKAVLGVETAPEAIALYLAHYPPRWTGLGAIRPMTMGEFKAWVADRTRSQHPVALPYTTRKDP